jgi:hypothetical protein
MKVTIYVNWDENIILSEKDFEKEVLNEADEKFNDSDFFSEWLSCCGFDFSEVFNFTESEKEVQREKFKKYCLEYIRDYLINNEYKTDDLEI